MKFSNLITREKQVVKDLISLGCRHYHRGHQDLCEECRALLMYAHNRLDRCPHGDRKPPCTACPVHCYSPENRRKIRKLMRWAGPRMILRHPLVTLLHLWDLMGNRTSTKNPQESLHKK